MKNYQSIFERHEKKYLIDAGAHHHLLRQLSSHMQEDEYGLHTISSMYCDTEDYRLIRASLQKPAFKEKMRLRCYGQPGKDDPVYLELKKKLDGVVYKRRIALPLTEAEAFLHGDHAIAGLGQIAREIEWFSSRHQLAPKIMLAYDRVALYDKEDQTLRITLDRNIRWRTDRLSLSHGSDGSILLPDNSTLMEIKVHGAMPVWLTRLLAENSLYPTSFSKYGVWYNQIHMTREVERYVG